VRREPEPFALWYGQLEMDSALDRNPVKPFKKGFSRVVSCSRTEEQFELCILDVLELAEMKMRQSEESIGQVRAD
jgi:hypothetical protein